MIKVLLGGSPCTYWSIAQKKGRETEPSGIGWELFENYVIARERFRPDVFLYENNVSAAMAVKEEVKRRLGVWEGPIIGGPDTGVRYIEINSALVSAQHRKRFYVHNCGAVGQPEDRGIVVNDILDIDGGKSEVRYRLRAVYLRDEWRGSGADGPIRIGDIGSESQGHRVYSCYGKSAAIKSAAGGQGGKTGLYAIPICLNSKSRKFGGKTDNNGQPSLQNRVYSPEGKMPAIATSFNPKVAYPAGRVGKEVYEVRDGLIELKGVKYPIKLRDGLYVIRKLTVTECERLQTLPDGYCRAASKAQAYKGLGNGWTAEVIVHVLSGALRDVPRDERIAVLSMYDGIGTGRHCLDRMGFRNVEYYAFETDESAKRIALSNYPDIIQCGDAYQVREGWFDGLASLRGRWGEGTAP